MIVAVVLGIAEFFIQLQSAISVAPYMTTNPKLPYETRFSIVNEGMLAIQDVHYSCLSWDIHSPNGYLSVNDKKPLSYIDSTDEFDVIEAKASDNSIRCWPPTFTGSLQDTFDSAYLEVRLTFRPVFYPRKVNRAVRFKLIRDSAGNAQWIHAGQQSSILDEWNKK